MIVGTVLDGQGRPICCELWPGNTTDVKTLIPVVDRLRSRFGIKRVCIVADRGMISKGTIDDLENDKRGWLYILGARMRAQREVRDEVISRGGRYRVVHPEREFSDDPSPLDVKEVWVGDHRYIVYRNQDEARKDAADRQAITVASLREQCRAREPNRWLGNRDYRRYLSTSGSDSFQVDEAKIAEDARYDGKWVLRTNTRDRCSREVALHRYKRLWMVEQWFRSSKSLIHTRPIFHHRLDVTIRGHVFCILLGLGAAAGVTDPSGETRARLQMGHDVIQDLGQLHTTEVQQDGKRFLLRDEVQGTCGGVFQAAGVALPPTVQQLAPPVIKEDDAHSATPIL